MLLLLIITPKRALSLREQTLRRTQGLQIRSPAHRRCYGQPCWNSCLLKILNPCNRPKDGVGWACLSWESSPKRCCSGIDRLIIEPDLRIFPCDAFKQIKAEELVGTLELSSLNGNSLSECWEHSPFLEAVREYLTTDFAEPCVSCQSLEQCLSGCLAQKVIANGNLKKSPDPLCLMR